MADLNPYQQKIVNRYYDNLDSISRQRLSELVSDLYLAEGRKRAGVWKKIESALQKLEIPQVRIDHLKKQDNPALLAELLTELEGKK